MAVVQQGSPMKPNQIISLFCMLIIAAMPVQAERGNNKEGHKIHHKHQHADPQIKHHALPPGLKMNSERGKPLPPGWRKKLHVGERLHDDVYRHGRVVTPLGVDGTLTIDVEGSRIRLHAESRKILHIFK